MKFKFAGQTGKTDEISLEMMADDLNTIRNIDRIGDSLIYAAALSALGKTEADERCVNIRGEHWPDVTYATRDFAYYPEQHKRILLGRKEYTPTDLDRLRKDLGVGDTHNSPSNSEISGAKTGIDGCNRTPKSWPI